MVFFETVLAILSQSPPLPNYKKGCKLPPAEAHLFTAVRMISTVGLHIVYVVDFAGVHSLCTELIDERSLKAALNKQVL